MFVRVLPDSQLSKACIDLSREQQNSKNKNENNKNKNKNNKNNDRRLVSLCLFKKSSPSSSPSAGAFGLSTRGFCVDTKSFGLITYGETHSRNCIGFFRLAISCIRISTSVKRNEDWVASGHTLSRCKLSQLPDRGRAGNESGSRKGSYEPIVEPLMWVQ